MKRLLLLLSAILTGFGLVNVEAAIEVSTTLPSDGTPEHLYTMVNGNSWYCDGNTHPTQTETSYGLFAFYAVDGVEDAYYIYSKTAGKWLSYTKSASYSAKKSFVTLSTSKGNYFKCDNYSGTLYQFSPYTSAGSAAAIYLNWYQGVSANTSNTLGLWTDKGSADAGSRWTVEEVIQLDPIEAYTPTIPANIDDILAAHTTSTYTNAVVYPAQDEAVGEARLDDQTTDIYTFYNNVLAATFFNDNGHLFFGGSAAMNLEPGTEPFTVAVGSGTVVPASAMTLKSLKTVDLTGSTDNIGGAEHYNGKALEAQYEFAYGSATLQITWRAVLRDGSHYLRTEMELQGTDDVKMYNVIPLIYSVNTKEAGSTPAVVGNTRGAMLLSNKIFAGVENPVAYNTVGDSTGDEDLYELTKTYSTVALTASSWTDMTDSEVPARIKETTGQEPSAIYEYKKSGYALTKNQKVEVTLDYTSGSHKLYIGGVDMYSTSATSIDANDYHMGYTGSVDDKNVYSFIVPNDGTYTIRLMLDGVSESINASSNLIVKVYTPKEGVVINTDVVAIKGRWSRNTTLEKGETWKVSAVVGLIAQDGKQAETDITKTQKRRSVLAYSERERAVPWRPNPAYISWYELNINRNNAAPGSEATNMQADEVIDIENQWKKNMFDHYGVGPESFVIDDGWDNYGTWTFHTAFPNEMRDISALAAQMGAGVGAWLGPVGGYGQSGTYRRKYWTDKGESMVLSNPNYYKVFKDAATNLVNNQGTKQNGQKSFQFFKFDGISAQFSAVGPDDGDTGNENAEGIIRLERFVREDLKRDIFFNTTVGTWASPFWYHFTDATWRQENDYGTIGDNSIDREKWITYRDRLVYQNYVQNSPVCPINTLMTHGFILSNFGSVSTNMTYDACLREMRCAFACGSGMVELYNDYSLMNSIKDNSGRAGALWKDLANLINWQKANADVLPDAHWVGGSPWDGSNENIYGWGAWNKDKAVLTLRNGDDGSTSKSITLTLRDALNIPADVTGTVTLKKCWSDQAALTGWPSTEAIDIDQSLTLTLPKNSVYMFSTSVVDELDYVAPEKEEGWIDDLDDLSNSKAYNIVCERGYLLYDSSQSQICGSNGKSISSTTKSKTDRNQQFLIIKDGTKYYLYSCGADKYVGAGGKYTSNRANAVTITASGNSSYPWMFKIGSNYFNLQAANQTDAGIVINSWSTKDAGNQYYITEAELADPTEYEETPRTVKVLGTDNAEAGLTFGSTTYKDGEQFTYGKLSTSQPAAIDLSTYNAVLNIIGDKAYVSYINKTEPLYTISGGNGGYVSTASGYTDDEALLLSNTTAPTSGSECLWMVRQQEDNTYRFYNYTTGWAKVLAISGSEADARATMQLYTTTADDDTYTTYFDGTINLGGQASYIKLSGSSNNYWNKRGNYLALWNSASGKGDTGSTFYINLVDADDYLGEQYVDYYAINKGTRPTDINKLSLWYDESAPAKGVSDTWMEYALPIGNGQIGATILGGVYRDEIQFNEKTLWEGTTANSSQGYYQNFGTIRVTDRSENFSLADDSKPVSGYVRYLDIMDGVAGVNYQSSNGSQYKHRYFTSAPDHVMVAHYEVSGDDKLCLDVKYVPDTRINASSVTYTATSATFSGALSTVKYNTKFELLTDGTATNNGVKGIRVEDATYVNLIMAAATDYDVTKTGAVSGETAEEIAAKVQTRIDAAKTTGYETLYENNKENYNELMGRVELNVGGESQLTTEALVTAYNASDDNKNSADGLFLETLYFQYGRYMTIAANNDQTIHAPSNLQGIWNDRSNTSFWHCDVHADINVEMNYWPADPTNLSEMHKPFVEHILDLAGATDSPWRTLATKLGGKTTGDWTVACENNIFGGTSTWCNSSMKTLGSWYVSHLWRYYKYSMDKDFLIRALPIMYANAQYTMDIASNDTETTSPGGETTLSKVILGEWSPEHGDGGPNAFAQQTASEAIYNTIDAYNELKNAGMAADCGVTEAQITALQTFFDTFDKGVHVENYTWTRDGVTYTDQPCISEWLHIALTDPSHRHLSHLMCVYPFGRINAFDKSEQGQKLFTAANNGILARNGDVTGWSMGWQTNVYARCLKGDNARGYLSKALKHSTSYTIQMGGCGGCYYNLFDAHSPFQIDGNYGCTSGVAEMLLQSYDDVITLLPALPTAWSKGSVKGLKAQGNFTVDETWNYEGDTKVLRATITSNAGAKLRIRTLVDGAKISLKDANGKAVEADEDGVYSLGTTKGATYTVNIANQTISNVAKKVKAAIDAQTTSTDDIDDLVNHLLLR